MASIANEERKLRVYRDYDRTGDPDLEPYLVVAKWLNPYQPNRGLGKISDLAFGYQGGVRAFRAFEPDKLNPMPEAKVEELKLRWRAQHPNVEGSGSQSSGPQSRPYSARALRLAAVVSASR